MDDHSSGQQPTESKPAAATQPDRQSILRQLRSQVGCVSVAAPPACETFSTGCQVIDDLLPIGGLKKNTVTEWVADSDSSGAAVFSLIAAATHLCQPTRQQRSCADGTSTGGPFAGGPLVVVDSESHFYPPAAVALGIPADQIILVRPERHADVVWAIDQALRCDAVGAVWGHVGSRLNDRDARRFQLAAEIGNTPGLLVRPAAVRGRPSFAEVRFHVQVADAHVQVGNAGAVGRRQAAPLFATPFLAAQITLDRCRGGQIGNQTWVQIDDRGRLTPLERKSILVASGRLAPITTAQTTSAQTTSAQTTTAQTTTVPAAVPHDTSHRPQTAAVHLAEQLARSASLKRDSQQSDSNRERRA
ncbi:MAG: hypothetical protein HKN47_18260 [Pirellulaceae bacterium]|nr:hypothetical protein [Pirellulaceae bacterium]